MNRINTIITHNGQFHADEVTSVATAYLLQGTMPAVIRTRNPELLVANANTLVIDVGGKYDPEQGYYDHHQRDFLLTHPEGSPMASAGIIWEKYGHALVALLSDSLDVSVIAPAAELVRKELVLAIDSIDTGHVRPKEGEYHFSHVVSSFNKKDIFSPEQDGAFVDAVRFVATILENVIVNALAKAAEHRKVEELVKSTSGNILVLPDFLDWEPVVKANATTNSISYVVFPSGGEYRIRAVEAKDYFNSDYSYQSSKVFIHKAGFIAGTKTLAEALALIDEHCALLPL